MTSQWNAFTWTRIAAESPEGIVVCDATQPELPVVYVNAAFAQLSGRAPDSLLGTNLRSLQAEDREQEGRRRVREAIQRGESCHALLRNYRPDGTSFWNEMYLQPVRDAGGRITHWIGYHRDAGERIGSERPVLGMPAWLREDRVSGLTARQYFDELLRRDWLIARRESRVISLTLFDIDRLGIYNETFERAAGDASIRRVARVLATSYRRASDLVGRWSGGTFAVVTQGDPQDKVVAYARVVAQRVRELAIHNPRSGGDRFITVSAGVGVGVPSDDLTLEGLIGGAGRALRHAKGAGRNTVGVAQSADYST